MSCDDVTVELVGVTKSSKGSKTKAPIGSAKTFRSYDQGQMFLMPPSLDDWLPKDHTARFISEVVDELLDLSVIYAFYVEASGGPPYDPTMMLKLLLYAYSTGVTSSREMEKRCHIDIAFRWLSANTTPDYRSLARFHRRHEKALGDLFNQVLVLCYEAGLVTLGGVILNGTRLSVARVRRLVNSRFRPAGSELPLCLEQRELQAYRKHRPVAQEPIIVEELFLSLRAHHGQPHTTIAFKNRPTEVYLSCPTPPFPTSKSSCEWRSASA